MPLPLARATAEPTQRRREIFALCLLAIALLLAQVLIGGARLLFFLPSIALLGAAVLLTLQSWRSIDQLCLGTAAAFVGYVVLRGLFSPVAYTARADVYSAAGALLAYLLGGCVILSPRNRARLFLVLVAFALAHVAVGAIQFRDGNEFMPIAWLRRAGYGHRASGFYVCPNHLAGLLEVVGIFALGIACWSRSRLTAKLIIGYGAAICYAGVILTGSRGGYLSTVASLAVFGLLSLIVLARGGSARFGKIGVAALACAIVAVAIVWFGFRQSDFLSARARATYDVQNVRLELWRAALQQWQLNPIFGTGSGTYLYYGREFRSEGVQVDPVHTHNDYIQLLAEYGIGGAVVALAMIVAHLRRAIRTFARTVLKPGAARPTALSDRLALNIATLSAIAAYVVHSCVDFNLHIPANALLLGFVFGIAGTRRSEVSTAAVPGVLWQRVATGLAATVILVQSIRLLPGEYFAERARVAVRDYRPADAIYLALRGLSYERANPYLHDYLGRGRLFAGDEASTPAARASFYAAAADAFHHASALAPLDETFFIHLASAYDRLQRFAEAEWIFGQAFALDPKSRLLRGYYEEHLAQWRAM